MKVDNNEVRRFGKVVLNVEVRMLIDAFFFSAHQLIP